MVGLAPLSDVAAIALGRQVKVLTMMYTYVYVYFYVYINMGYTNYNSYLDRSYFFTSLKKKPCTLMIPLTNHGSSESTGGPYNLPKLCVLGLLWVYLVWWINLDIAIGDKSGRVNSL